MKELMQVNQPDISITTTLLPAGGANIDMELSQPAFDFIKGITFKRAKQLRRHFGVEDMLMESLRVEQLLADRMLLVKEFGVVQELVSA